MLPQDVQIASGVDSTEHVFGLEAAGIVRHTGPEAKRLQVGDRVMVFARDAFSSVITTSESLCVKCPTELGFTDAATMPLAYSVALYSLIDVGGLQKGQVSLHEQVEKGINNMSQSVLIHSAAGSVGLAAIQVASMIGAEVYATVSSDEKIKILTEQFGVCPNRIFNSRDTSFADGIKRATSGKGVDVVLNSLSGELLHASWRCVAEFGKMVEIGKRDLSGAAKLDMEVFLLNRSYACVDMDRIRAVKPGVIAR